ncbi:MAG: hypothetical protein NC213_08015 [Acetobacter sp.]|nr:hypothetical protein [Bacteroides sp.]MCM1341674.1 hypothetical protein [Acetobacter sp.]MCM1434277.1 hypothetical protein [Clostridiales bacterium]
MKDFEDFKDSISNEKLNQIFNSRLTKIKEYEKELEFEDETENMIWFQRCQTVGLIFDFLEEYHNWLNK